LWISRRGLSLEWREFCAHLQCYQHLLHQTRLKSPRRKHAACSFIEKTKIPEKKNGWFKLLSINRFFNVPLGLKTKSAFKKVINIRIKPKQSKAKN